MLRTFCPFLVQIVGNQRIEKYAGDFTSLLCLCRVVLLCPGFLEPVVKQLCLPFGALSRVMILFWRHFNFRLSIGIECFMYIYACTVTPNVSVNF